MGQKQVMFRNVQSACILPVRWITIFLKDGSSVKKKGSGREFIWDFNHEAERLQEIIPGIPIQEEQFQSLIRMCKTLNQRDRADELIQLTQK